MTASRAVIIKTCMSSHFYPLFLQVWRVGSRRQHYKYMAQKRMLSKQIIDSDAFLDMSPTAQLLYFHLVMRADDEGFVGNPRKIMREVGIQNDDFKILIAKRFVLTFESGVIVIKHWLIHNTIRMDRFQPTAYQDEKSLLITKENKAYTELETNGLPFGNQVATQVKLSEVKLSKPNIEKMVFGEFNNVYLKEEEHDKLVGSMGEKNVNILIEELSSYMASKGKRYSSHYATLLSWARRKVQDHKN